MESVTFCFPGTLTAMKSDFGGRFCYRQVQHNILQGEKKMCKNEMLFVAQVDDAWKEVMILEGQLSGSHPVTSNQFGVVGHSAISVDRVHVQVSVLTSK